MRKLKLSLLTLAIAGFIVSCNNSNKSDSESQATLQEVNDEPKSLSYDINALGGSGIEGTVSFTQEGDEVTMQVQVTGLIPGTHGIHLHETADCSAVDGTSTGGHWNPSGHEHGKWEASDNFHAGDIGNLEADEKGNATLTFTTDKWCIGCNDEAKNIIGRGLIIHADADDFTTQPTGNAGGRIGCVEIL
ncbi:MAG: superoxide dismutase family protein [Chitinophagales bacterium]|nr:superoxide dismutase family protein [Chitinophagales bacterium]